jgi:hypothetical protein
MARPETGNGYDCRALPAKFIDPSPATISTSSCGDQA